MKILIVHLSDIHIRPPEKQNPILSRAEQIAAAVSSTDLDVGCCFIVVTGDIAYSGYSAEYALANTFFNELQSQLNARLIECESRFVLVPGNHDCDFSESNSARDIVLSNLTLSDLDASIFSTCTQVQSNYEAFAKRWHAENSDERRVSSVYRNEIYKREGETIEFRLLNSAWMSRLKENQGSILFPVEILQPNGHSQSEESLVVALLHHPYNWFEATNGRALYSEIEASSDIILTGHEHDGDHYQKNRILGERNEYLEGMVLQDSDDPHRSGFHVIAIDLDEQTQEIYTFSWKQKLNRYEPEGDVATRPFQRNPYRLRDKFALDDAFEAFLTDPGAKFIHPEKEEIRLDDLFVYPDLRRLNRPDETTQTREIIRDDLPGFIVDSQRVLLVGSEKSGKTALSKVLFQDLRNRGLVPIHLSGLELKGYTKRSVYSAIEKTFEREYASPDINAFRQLEQAKRAVIVDDFQKSPINARGRDCVIQTLEEFFDIIILLGDEQLRFTDLIDREGEELALWHFTHCDILQFGNLRRSDLIHKWYFLGRRFTHDGRELSRLAIQAEKTVRSLLGKNFIPSYPIFVLIMLQQMETRRPLDTAATSGSYGFLYESLLTMALAHSSQLDEDLGTQHTYLSEFAYFLFTKRLHSIADDEALDWHRHHCSEYDLDLNFERILSGFDEAGVTCIKGNHISFRYPYIYYYFVARYFRDHIDEKEIRDQISLMSRRLYHTESANIIMFLTYLSMDPFVLSSILEASRNLFSSYSECELEEDTEFLTNLITNVRQLILDSSLPSERRRKLLAHKDELESDEVTPEESETIEHEPDLDEDLQEVLQVNVAFKTIQILGQTLRNFPGSLKRGPKLELARECYSLGLRLLKYLFEVTESHQEELVWLLTEFLRSDQPNWNDEQITKRVKEFLFYLIESLTFAVIKQVSDSVGLDKLSKTFREVLKENNSTAYRFIDLSVQLDYYANFPEQEVFSLDKDTRKNPFSAHLLRLLVWHYFYIHESGYKLRQSICAKLDIKLLPSEIYDHRVKRLRN